MTEQLANFGVTTVNEALDANETTVTVTDGSVFPAEGDFRVNVEDEIIRDTMVASEGDVPHSRIRDLLGLEPLIDDKEVEMEPEIISEAPQASDESIKVDLYADDSDKPSDADAS